LDGPGSWIVGKEWLVLRSGYDTNQISTTPQQFLAIKMRNSLNPCFSLYENENHAFF